MLYNFYVPWIKWILVQLKVHVYFFVLRPFFLSRTSKVKV
jgi:hypothetical protein